MRILFLSNLWPPYYLGGYELAAANVAKALASRGHEIMVLTSPSHLVGTEDPAYVQRTMPLNWFFPFKHRNLDHERLAITKSAIGEFEHGYRLLAAIRTFQPDVVYCWNIFAIGGLSLLDILNIGGVPTVIHLMDKLPEFIYSNAPPITRPIFGRVGGETIAKVRTIAMSEHLVEEVANDTGIEFRSAPEIIPGWVDVENVAVRSRYREKGIVRFVTAGAVVPHKGIGLIVEAAARLVSSGRSDFVIDVFGEGEVDRFVEQATALGINDLVAFRGGRKQRFLLESYASYDAFLFPTWEREPFGFAPIEAAAAGCVPIMTANCGASERLVDGVHCVKIERTVEQLTAAMAGVIDGKYDLEALGSAASRLVREQLNLESVIEQIEDVLRKAARSDYRMTPVSPKENLLCFVKHHLAMSLAFDV